MKIQARKIGLGRIRHAETDNQWVPIVGLYHNTRSEQHEVLISVFMRGVVRAFLVSDLEEVEYEQYV